jgi:hypothetical protein
MKKTFAVLALAGLATLTPAGAFAQSITIPDRVEKLAARADQTVNVTLDGPLLQLAAQFMNGRGGNEAEVKNLISKLKGIHVRSFEFSKDGQYSEADVESMRSQLRAPWTRVFETRGNKEHVEIFLKQDKGELGGLVILSAEPRELTIVSIDGPIDLKKLAALGGQFGIPKLDPAALGAGSSVSPGSRLSPDPKPAKDGDE